MAKIAIANLSLAGSDLFLDSDSFLSDLTDIELEGTNGGGTPAAVAVGLAVGAAAGAAIAVAGVGVGVAISVALK